VTVMSWESRAVRGAMLEDARSVVLMGGSARRRDSCALVDMSVTVGSGPKHRIWLRQRRRPKELGRLLRPLQHRTLRQQRA
jgi:hypothetical protein